MQWAGVGRGATRGGHGWVEVRHEVLCAYWAARTARRMRGVQLVRSGSQGPLEVGAREPYALRSAVYRASPRVIAGLGRVSAQLTEVVSPLSCGDSAQRREFVILVPI